MRCGEAAVEHAADGNHVCCHLGNGGEGEDGVEGVGGAEVDEGDAVEVLAGAQGGFGGMVENIGAYVSKCSCTSYETYRMEKAPEKRTALTGTR